MKNINKILLILLIVFGGLTSCNQSEINCDDAENYDINQIVLADNQEVAIVSDFFRDFGQIDNLKFGTEYLYDDPKVVKYTNLPGKSIVVNYKSEESNSNIEKSLILVISDDDEILTYYEYEKIKNGETYTVNTFIEGSPWFTSKVMTETDEIIDFNMLLSNNLKMTFMECAEMAVGVCLDDGECAFLCGIIWEYCLGSIGLACAYTAITT